MSNNTDDLSIGKIILGLLFIVVVVPLAILKFFKMLDELLT